MPQTGGAINAPKKKPPKAAPKAIKPPPGRAKETAQNVTQKKGASGPPAAGSYSVSAGTSRTPTTKTADLKKTGGVKKTWNKGVGGQAGDGTKGGAFDKGKEGSRKANKDRFGFNSNLAGDKPRNRSGGLATEGGGGGGDRPGTSNKGIPESGANDGGKLGGAFKDSNLVGSHNTITDFDGSSLSGGDESGGGGGSGSSLAGRESVGLVGDTKGQSLDEVVYGVKKRGKKVARARGE